MKSLEEQLLEAQQERDQARAGTERDRTKLADALKPIREATASRFWLTEGRGCYEWDDDKYREEFGHAITEINVAIEGLESVATDWRDCPQTSAEVAKARIDLQQQVTQQAATINQLVEAFKFYGSHEDECAWRQSDYRQCSCGFLNAVKNADAALANRCGKLLESEVAELEAQLRQSESRNEHQLELIIAVRDILASLQKPLGYLPQQNAYSTKMTENEMLCAKAINDLSDFIEAEKRSGQ